VKRKASRSDAQQSAELLMLDEFSRQIGKELKASTIPIGQAVVSVDGFLKEGDIVILAEAWAHIGKAKSAQRNKVLGDLLKLAFINSVLRICLRTRPGGRPGLQSRHKVSRVSAGFSL